MTLDQVQVYLYEADEQQRRELEAQSMFIIRDLGKAFGGS